MPDPRPEDVAAAEAVVLRLHTYFDGVESRDGTARNIIATAIAAAREEGKHEGYRMGMIHAESIVNADAIGPNDGASTCCVESFNLANRSASKAIRARISEREKGEA